jgi:hypothetical protein
MKEYDGLNHYKQMHPATPRCFAEGVGARFRGEQSTVNPHNPGTDEYRSCAAGWDAADTGGPGLETTCYRDSTPPELS